MGKLQFIHSTINADTYKTILTESLLPSIPICQSVEGDFVFQQDGAACHTAKAVKHWLTEHQITTLPWPSSSPDFSPIESLWHKMKKELRKNLARIVIELKTKLQEIWYNIQPDECAQLVNTMPNRITAAMINKEDVTQY